MKKKKEVYIVVAILAVIIIAVKLLTSKGPYEGYQHAKVSAMSIKGALEDTETNYFYMYDPDDEDCKEIEDVIFDFADTTDKNLFFVDITVHKDNISEYDWTTHHTQYDVEIGKVEDDDTKTYNDGQSEEMYLNTTETDPFGHPLKYEIIIADEDYLKVNENATLDCIYASLLTPMESYEYLGPRSPFVVADTPTFVEITRMTVTDVYHGKDAVLEAIK